MSLSAEHARQFAKETPPLDAAEVKILAQEIPEWTVKGKSIERMFKFADFQQAMVFVNQVADIAQQEDHHPDVCISYNQVRIELSTHKVGGLSRNDFIVASKIDVIAE